MRTLDDARQYSANLGAWGASAAWAHRWWLPALGDYNEVLFPGILTLVSDASASHDASRARDTAILYLLIAVLRVLVRLWAGRRPLPAVLRDHSDLHLPPRARTDGRHGHARRRRFRVHRPRALLGQCQGQASPITRSSPPWRSRSCRRCR